MAKKNFSKPILFVLVGMILGILISQLLLPQLEEFFFFQFESKKAPISLERPPEEKIAKTCEKAKKEKKAIEVNLAEQTLRMCENGNLIKEITISSGKKETPTPFGNFRIIHKSLMLYSKLTDCWLPFWVGFEGDYGFHEVPICKKEWGRTGLADLGQPVSAGCIRLGIDDAEKFYQWTESETPVIIY